MNVERIVAQKIFQPIAAIKIVIDKLLHYYRNNNEKTDLESGRLIFVDT